MIVYADTSALVARHLDLPARRVVLDAAAQADAWCTSAIALTEALALVDRLTDDADRRERLEDLIRLDWDRCYVVPVDQRCLDRAGVLARQQPVRLSDAIHLAAADRLPRPATFLTFDPAQIPVALALDLEVLST
jgi:uncharacterized protein